jgi:acyl-CoA synthetase (AMP-forming)/AMP-acid ligase II
MPRSERRDALESVVVAEFKATRMMADPRWGEAVRAAVVLRDGHRATARDLMVFLHGRIADYKAPTGYVFVDVLPRNPTGKVRQG